LEKRRKKENKINRFPISYFPYKPAATKDMENEELELFCTYFPPLIAFFAYGCD